MDARLSAVIVSVFAVGVLAIACSQGVETTAQASPRQQAGRAPSTPAANPPATREPVLLEFDVPNEFSARAAGSGDAITGFRIGYFRGDDQVALRTIDVRRDALTLQEHTARVALPAESVPEGEGGLTIRVQSLSREGASAWSEPVRLAARDVSTPPARTPQRPAAAARTSAGRAPGTGRRRGGGLVSADLENQAALAETLRKLLPADTKIETELLRFRRVADLALAVVISRDHDIPFTTLSQTMAGPPRMSLRNALGALRRDVDIVSAMRKARTEARRLAPATPGNRRPSP